MNTITAKKSIISKTSRLPKSGNMFLDLTDGGRTKGMPAKEFLKILLDFERSHGRQNI